MAWAAFHASLAAAVGMQAAPNQVQVRGDAQLPSAFAVTDFAVGALATAGQATARLASILGGVESPDVEVDSRLASIWFGRTIGPVGWELPGVWDEIAGIYRAGDRCIRLHTNAPHHRAAAVAVLGCADERAAVTASVGQWDAFELHEAIVAAGGVAAAMRSRVEWTEHPQGRALATEPLVHHEVAAPSAVPASGSADPSRPLAGVRVLDLTRVLAGPVSTRWLAGLGADVLRIDPPWWDEPAVVPDVNLGKRCARLDLTVDADRERFEELLAEADILVHGYRLGALAGLGYDADVLRSINPGLVDVSLNAWGHTGPWSERRGFDSIVQVAAGIAEHGMQSYGSDTPRPLPVQALDHTAGYTMTACALQGWCDRLEQGHGSTWRTSLAAHAELLWQVDSPQLDATFAELGDDDFAPGEESTVWGPMRRARSPVAIAGVDVGWRHGATNHGSEPTATW